MSEEYEILDLTDYIDRSWIQQAFQNVSKQSVAKQIAIGGATGWFAGYLFAKVGKIAAATLGTSLILIQVAQHQGYIKINWSKFNNSVNRVKKRIESETTRNAPRIVENVSQMQLFVRNNAFVAGGFTGGFLLGIAC